MLFLYTMRDRAPYGGTEREDYFGLTRTDGTPKPFHEQMRTWVLG